MCTAVEPSRDGGFTPTHLLKLAPHRPPWRSSSSAPPGVNHPQIPQYAAIHHMEIPLENHSSLTYYTRWLLHNLDRSYNGIQRHGDISFKVLTLTSLPV